MDLIANADVDFIDICLPTFLHAKYALAAMEKVKYLFVEKPVTLTVAESEELIAKSKACNCQVQVGQGIRFWDEYVALKRMVDKNLYGKIVNANFRRNSHVPIGIGMTGCWIILCPAALHRICISTISTTCFLCWESPKISIPSRTLTEKRIPI